MEGISERKFMVFAMIALIIMFSAAFGLMGNGSVHSENTIGNIAKPPASSSSKGGGDIEIGRLE